MTHSSWSRLSSVWIDHKCASPYYFNLCSAFHLFFLPHMFIPVQIEEHDYHRRDELQVFLHPWCFKSAFWYVPLIRCSLQGTRLQFIKHFKKNFVGTSGDDYLTFQSRVRSLCLRALSAARNEITLFIYIILIHKEQTSVSTEFQ